MVTQPPIARNDTPKTVRKIFSDANNEVLAGNVTRRVVMQQLRRACPYIYQNDDAREEMLAMFVDRVHQFCRGEPVSKVVGMRILREILHYASSRREPCYDTNHPRHGVCRDANRCVVPGHPERNKWAGQRYIPAWLKAMAEKIDRDHPTTSGIAREWQIIVLSTGPTAEEDGQSLEDMLTAARSFSRVHGFRWDHFLTKTNPRRKRDNRVIKADKFLLEARVELVPARTVSGTVAYRTSNDMNNSLRQHSVCHPTSESGWGIQWVFAYYGEPLDEDAMSRLQRRWLKHPRNRGRSGVHCIVSAMPNAGAALSAIQLYRTPALGLPGRERVQFARLRAECGLKRVFRLGIGRGQVKVAKRLWKTALAITDRQMFTSAVSGEDWATAIVGALDWREAMCRLSNQADRKLAFFYRWKYRREVIYPKLLGRYLEHGSIGVSLVSFTREEDEGIGASTAQQEVRAQFDNLTLLLRSQHTASMERLARIEAQIAALSRDLKAGHITRIQFDQRRKRLDEERFDVVYVRDRAVKTTVPTYPERQKDTKHVIAPI